MYPVATLYTPQKQGNNGLSAPSVVVIDLYTNMK